MYLLWTVPFVLIIFALYIPVCIVPYFVLSLFFMNKAATTYLYKASRLVEKLGFWITGINLNIEIDAESKKLLDSGKAVCFVCNHTSLLDIPVVLYSTRAKMGFVTKYIIAFIPVLNLFALALKCVFIDRKNSKRSIESIRKASIRIENGHSMLIFPEGTRSKTGLIAPFKKGSFRIAFNSGAEIVPVVIKGVRQAAEGRKKCFGRYESYCTVGKPVATSAGDSREVRFEKINIIEEYIRETYASLGDK